MRSQAKRDDFKVIGGGYTFETKLNMMETVARF